MTRHDSVDRRRPAVRSNVVREVALTLGALAGLLCVTAAVLAIFFGITPLIFRSGSMSPSIETGALALSKQTAASDLRVGDVVNVTNSAGSQITHRIVDLQMSGVDTAIVQLKGDANELPDAESYVVESARRVFVDVPTLGYAVTWLSGPIAVFAGGVLVGILLMIAWRPRSGRDTSDSAATDRDSPPGRHSRTPSALLIVTALVGATAMVSSQTPTTLAALTDSASAASGSFGTAGLAAPTGLSCANQPGLLGIGAYARITWTQPTTSGLSFRWTIRQAGSPAITPTTVTTRTADVQNSLLLGGLSGTYIFSVQTVSGTMVSAPSATYGITMNPGVLGVLLPTASCGAAGATARLAPQAAPTTTTPAPASTTAPATTTEQQATTTTPPAATTTPPATTTTELPPAAVEPPPVPVTTTTTTAAPPADLISPQSSPSGSAVAKVVSVDGSPTLQITDLSGDVQYSGPISSSSEYGYGVTWASGDELWLLGPSQLVRLDGTGGGWSRSVVDPSSEEVPAEISALLN